MHLVTAVVYCLMVIVASSLILLYLILKKINNVDKAKVNLEKKIFVPKSTIIEDMEGNSVSIFENEIEKKSTYILLDIECEECKKILKKLELLNERYFENIGLLIVKNDNNVKKIKKTSYKNRSFLVDEGVLQKLDIKAFPMYIKVDPNKNLISKGSIDISNILNLVEVEDSIL